MSVESLNPEDIRNIYTYALSHCKNECPAERDPEKCWSMVAVARFLGLLEPPCVKEWGGFTVERLETVIRRIEMRRGKPILLILEDFSRHGIQTLEDMIDHQEATFTLRLIEVLKRRGEPPSRRTTQRRHP